MKVKLRDADLVDGAEPGKYRVKGFWSSYTATQGVIWMHPGCVLGAPRVRFGCTQGAFWVHPGCVLGAPRVRKDILDHRSVNHSARTGALDGPWVAADGTTINNLEGMHSVWKNDGKRRFAFFGRQISTQRGWDDAEARRIQFVTWCVNVGLRGGCLWQSWLQALREWCRAGRPIAERV